MERARFMARSCKNEEEECKISASGSVAGAGIRRHRHDRSLDGMWRPNYPSPTKAICQRYPLQTGTVSN
jgi:hypothetical protein